MDNVIILEKQVKMDFFQQLLIFQNALSLKILFRSNKRRAGVSNLLTLNMMQVMDRSIVVKPVQLSLI